MRLNFSDLKIIKANPNMIKSIEFDCEDDDLNEFLLKDSIKNIKYNLCTLFLCYYKDNVVGFFSLSADSIKINEKLEINYSAYPAVKIGRLAVSKEFQNLCIGSFIINWIIGFCRKLREEIGIRFISVDAYNNEKTLKFYKNNFFVSFKSNQEKHRNIPLYRDICEKYNYQ